MWTFVAGLAASALFAVEPARVRRVAVGVIVNTALGAKGAQRWVERTVIEFAETIEDIVAEARETDRID